MVDYMTAKQAAEKWSVSIRWVQTLLKRGRIKGAFRFGRDYMIPKDAEKPVDRRTIDYRELKKESRPDE